MTQVTKYVILVIRQPCSAWVLVGENLIEEIKEEKKKATKIFQGKNKIFSMENGLGTKQVC
jgi:hypothetical protein